MASSFVQYMLKKTPKKLGRIKHVPKNLGFFFSNKQFFYFLFYVGKEHRRDGLRT